MPEVKPSAAHFADTDADLLGRALPVGGVAGDQQSALFGQACFGPGMAKNTYGTGCFLLMHTGESFQPSTQRPAGHQRGADCQPRRNTRWKAACSSPAQWCNGCATA